MRYNCKYFVTSFNTRQVNEEAGLVRQDTQHIKARKNLSKSNFSIYSGSVPGQSNVAFLSCQNL
jgi:hypothetical protein